MLALWTASDKLMLRGTFLPAAYQFPYPAAEVFTGPVCGLEDFCMVVLGLGDPCSHIGYAGNPQNLNAQIIGCDDFRHG